MPPPPPPPPLSTNSLLGSNKQDKQPKSEGLGFLGEIRQRRDCFDKSAGLGGSGQAKASFLSSTPGKVSEREIPDSAGPLSLQDELNAAVQKRNQANKVPTA